MVLWQRSACLTGAALLLVFFVHLLGMVDQQHHLPAGVAANGAEPARPQGRADLQEFRTAIGTPRQDLGSASALIDRRCVTYRVECVPGSVPAAGRIVGVVPTPPAHEFCKGHGDVEPGRTRIKCVCPAEPLSSPAARSTTACEPSAHYLAYQCASVSLLPPGVGHDVAHAGEAGATRATLDRAAPPGASRSGSDARGLAGVHVLLVISECFGHGLFAQVER
ncbi:hypothetical protein T492DRAFT_919863 [Pavlovales sp. CCMP2436]|nr:hypothetical protein T492DRAFT_919863 [Pavlovales sp. CCMP2436]